MTPYCARAHVVPNNSGVTSFSPFFSSFDLRQQSLDSQGKIWASETDLEAARAQLHTHSEPTAVLALHGVTQEDAGTYRCRVDFKRSPTRYRKITLDVIGKSCPITPVDGATFEDETALLEKRPFYHKYN